MLNCLKYTIKSRQNGIKTMSGLAATAILPFAQKLSLAEKTV